MNFHFKNKLVLILVVLLLVYPSFCNASDQDDEPETSVPKIFALSMIRFYQKFISPLLGQDKCNFTLSCSRYGYRAVEKYGALRGTIMAFERVSRDHPFVWKEKYDVENGLLVDPVEDNVW